MLSPKRLLLAFLLCVTVLGAARAADLLQSERIGPLHYGAAQAAVEKAFGKPTRRSKEDYEAATGLFVLTWSYPGLEVGLSGPKKGGPKTVSRITVKRTGLSTARGIHVGSSETEARKAYAAEIDKGESSSGQVVAGSVYGGVIFTIRKGKVTEIFMGAAAE